VASKTLPTTPNKDLPNNSNSQYLLLDAEAQNLLRVFSLTSEDSVYLYVLVFIATTSSNSGGFFCLIDTSSDQFEEVGIIACPKHTAHCHLQDFMVKDKMLYALWDSQGQSMLERTEIKKELDFQHAIPPSWTTHYYAHQPELTPAYMEDQLLCTGSLTEIFLKNIMKPGVFSSFTLRTALDKYIDACLSLPGPPPPQLLNSHSTLCEKIAAVVGCTVTLNRDPQTGGFQHANYWTALKRDWEGFVARCREVERSARWPLIIGSHGLDGVIIVERERAASLVAEDIPIYIRRMLERDQSLHPQYNIFGIIWEARSKLGTRLMSGLENQAIDIMHQEIAFSFAEILQDQARRIKFKDSLDEGAVDWVIGRLQSFDVDQATRTGLDSIGSFDMTVKHEQTDAELLNVVPGSPWELSQVAAYTVTTIEARYELCFCLVVLLFLLSEELPTWDASLLAEVFAVFRGVTMLRYVASQPTETPHSTGRATISSPDDVVTQMRNMNVSNTKSHFASRTSLLQLLIPSSTPTNGIASTAHNFLDLGGLLQSLSPAHATKYEISLCERLSSLGFHDVTRELLSWLPRTPAVTFLQSQVWLRLGRVDDAAYLLESLAGSFGLFSFNVCRRFTHSAQVSII
jgi:nuclear pore complex protein Nup160